MSLILLDSDGNEVEDDESDEDDVAVAPRRLQWFPMLARKILNGKLLITKPVIGCDWFKVYLSIGKIID